MVHILGVQLPDSKIAKFALLRFYGIGQKTAHRLCARLQIHDTCKVGQLSPTQITALTSFLSSPSTTPIPPRFPLASPSFAPPPPGTPVQQIQDVLRSASSNVGSKDALRNLKIELELKREMRDNIAHQRMIGSYVGRRHAMGLPVRGQNTQSNAKTAKRLNRVDRVR